MSTRARDTKVSTKVSPRDAHEERVLRATDRALAMGRAPPRSRCAPSWGSLKT